MAEKMSAEEIYSSTKKLFPAEGYGWKEMFDNEGLKLVIGKKNNQITYKFITNIPREIKNGRYFPCYDCIEAAYVLKKEFEKQGYDCECFNLGSDVYDSDVGVILSGQDKVYSMAPYVYDGNIRVLSTHTDMDRIWADREFYNSASEDGRQIYLGWFSNGKRLYLGSVGFQFVEDCSYFELFFAAKLHDPGNQLSACDISFGLDAEKIRMLKAFNEGELLQFLEGTKAKNFTPGVGKNEVRNELGDLVDSCWKELFVKILRTMDEDFINEISPDAGQADTTDDSNNYSEREALEILKNNKQQREMEISKATKPQNILTVITGFLAFISGLYQGYAKSKNIALDPIMQSFIRFGPIVFVALLTFWMISIGVIKSRKHYIDAGISPERAEVLLMDQKKEAYFGGPIATSAIFAVIEFMGYMIGSWFGKRF